MNTVSVNVQESVCIILSNILGGQTFFCRSLSGAEEIWDFFVLNVFFEQLCIKGWKQFDFLFKMGSRQQEL